MRKRPQPKASDLFNNPYAVALFLLLCGFAIYASTLGNKFLLDDESQVLQNELIHSPANLPVFFLGSTMNQASTSLGGIYYKPVMSVCYSLLWWLSPGESWQFHLWQLLLAVANAFLAYLFLRRLLAPSLAAGCALLFLVHPLNTEVVTYIADLQDTLFMLFGLAALNLAAAGVKLPLGRTLALAALFLLSLLSKESGVLFLAITLLYSYVFLRQRFTRVVAAAVVSSAIYLYMRLGLAHLNVLSHQQNQIDRADFITRAMTAPKALGSYLWKFVFPSGISATQDWVVPGADFGDFWLPLMLLTIVLALSVGYALHSLRRGERAFAFFTFWVFMGMGLHSHLLVPLDGTVADRWFYFPSLGLIAMLALLCEDLIVRKFPRALFAGFALLALALAARSFVRGQDWYDNYTLCLHDVELVPNSYDLHNNLGVEYYRRGRVLEAKKEFERSVELAPNWDINWNNLGAVYNSLGDLPKAEADYRKSMQNGYYYLAYENYANILVREGRIAEAKNFIVEKALPMFPQSAVLKNLFESIKNK